MRGDARRAGSGTSARSTATTVRLQRHRQPQRLARARPANQTELLRRPLGVDQFARPTSTSRGSSTSGLAGPLNVAFGVEFRREGYQINAGEPNSYIDGGVPDQFGGRRRAGRAGVPRLPAVQRGRRLAQQLRRLRRPRGRRARDAAPRPRRALRGLQRLRQHRDGKLTARFEPHPSVRPARRGRAPASARRRSASRTSRRSARTSCAVGGVLVPFEVGTFPVEQPVARALGAEDLKPEESEHSAPASSGTRSTPLELTADYYRIDIDDRIVLSGNFTGGADQRRCSRRSAPPARASSPTPSTPDRRLRPDGRLHASSWTRQPPAALRPRYNTTENEIVRIADDAAAARGLRGGAVRPHRAPPRRVRPAARTTSGSRATGTAARFGDVGRVAATASTASSTARVVRPGLRSRVAGRPRGRATSFGNALTRRRRPEPLRHFPGPQPGRRTRTSASSPTRATRRSA